MAAGEATAEQLTDARPHLRNCPACRARLKALHRRPFAAMLPVGLVSLLGRFGGMVERLLPGGDASMTAASGTKLAALLATGAAATAGGGFVMAQEQATPHHAKARTPVAHAAPARTTATPPASTVRVSSSAVTPATRSSPSREGATRHRVVAHPKAVKTTSEFAPSGTPVPVPVAKPTPKVTTTAPIQRSASAPSPSATATATATPRQLPHPTTPDTAHGEFSPQP